MLDNLSQGPKNMGLFHAKIVNSRSCIQAVRISPKNTQNPEKKEKFFKFPSAQTPSFKITKTSTEKEVLVDLIIRILKGHSKNCKVLRRKIDKVKFSKFFNT